MLPGLIGMHVHQPPDTPLGDVELAALLFLRHGVTAVRDTGSFDGAIFAERKRIEAGEIAGPRIFACGPILDGDPPFWSGSRVVRTAAEGRRAVDELAALHVNCIKVYDRISADALQGIREAAERHELPVIGHVPSAIPFSEARLADVQHLTGLVEPGEAHRSARARHRDRVGGAAYRAHADPGVPRSGGALTDYQRASPRPRSGCCHATIARSCGTPRTTRVCAASARPMKRPCRRRCATRSTSSSSSPTPASRSTSAPTP